MYALHKPIVIHSVFYNYDNVVSSFILDNKILPSLLCVEAYSWYWYYFYWWSMSGHQFQIFLLLVYICATLSSKWDLIFKKHSYFSKFFIHFHMDLHSPPFKDVNFKPPLTKMKLCRKSVSFSPTVEMSINRRHSFMVRRGKLKADAQGKFFLHSGRCLEHTPVTVVDADMIVTL